MPKWLDWATNEIGVHETPGPESTGRITFYDSFTTLKATDDSVAWCSAFACAAMECNDIPSPRSAHARDWLKWGELLNIPVVGCIVVFKRGSDPNSGHVGFYLGHNAGLVKVLGGNQSDSVKISHYPQEDVLGYRWPEGVAR